MKKRAKNYWERMLFNHTQEIRDSLKSNNSLEIKKSVFNALVEVINIETSTYCNRTCNYCPLSIYDRKSTQNLMDENIFIKIINELKELNYNKSISLNLYNEPLRDPDLLKKIIQIKSILPETHLVFNTNGDYLNDKNLKELSLSGSDEIRVTLHSNNNEYSTYKQIQRFENFYKRIKTDFYPIKFLNPYNLISEFYIEKTLIVVMSIFWDMYGNDRAGIIKKLSLKENRTNPCMKPFREITIGYNGKVYTCCQVISEKENDYLIVGDISNNSILDSYFSNLMISFRKGLLTFSEKKLPPCNTCKDPDNSDISSQEIRQKIINDLD